MRNPTIAYPFAQCKAELKDITTERPLKNSTSNNIVSPIAVESASRPHVFADNRARNANDKKDPIEAKPRPSHGIISDSKSSSADRIVPRVKPRPPNSKNEVPYDFMMRTQSTKHSNVLQTRSGSQVPRVSDGDTEGSVEGSILIYPLDARSRMKISDTPHCTTFSLAKDCTPENSVRLKSAPAVTKSPSHPIPQPRPQTLTFRVAQEKPGSAGTYTQSPSCKGLQIVKCSKSEEEKPGPAGAYTQVSSSRGLQTLKCSKSEEVRVVSDVKGSYTRSNSWTRPPAHFGPTSGHSVTTHYQSGLTHTSYTRRNSNPSRYLQHLQSALVPNHGINPSVSANGVKNGATPNYSICDFRDGKKSYGRDPRWIQQRQVSAPSITRCQTIGAQYQSEGSALRQIPRNWPESPSSRIAQRLAVTSALKRELTTTSTSEPMIKFVDKVPGSSIKSQLRSENEYQHGENSYQTDDDSYQIGDKGYKPNKILYPSSGKKNQSEVFASAGCRAMNDRRGCGNHTNGLFRRESKPHMRSSAGQNSSLIDLSELRDVLSPLNAADRDLTRSMGSILDRKNHSVYTAPTRSTMATTRQTRQHAAQLKAKSDAQYKPDKQPKYEQATGYARPMYAMNGNASILTKRSRSRSVDGHFVSNTHRLGSQPQTVNMNYTTVPLTNASPIKARNKLSLSATGTDIVNGQDKLSMSKFTSWK
ncbi:hypothetical protein SARC_09961 [Sphaeroforma arctica JP610]|uniref:Uncharacterized protein n=1 Tax=Sphaeroforma arctica JP610 TaxID=667725 RepID=A0A0L0FLD2_9EUKA|nr:hypothetical protein SARC_09961 [Sphaeroforma arctica JP610]KNC77579.1 hypothetical protein SARC_09961 [Sphaeroforma arctica JP610]|eukprot:XP_014151481.1 hypothetical protein SARC_09961 [Sphaeroforma arctica JP610]